jgi:hypothetical protein
VVVAEFVTLLSMADATGLRQFECRRVRRTLR